VTKFVDTSALYALVDENDQNHDSAERWLAGPGRDPSELLVTHSYVVVESIALIRRRLGANAVRLLVDTLLPALSVLYVDESLHRAATIAFMAALGQKPSFVDHVSFRMMRDERIDHAFAFDADFARQGFHLEP
jgi:predicted nucleic acid-binding protein